MLSPQNSNDRAQAIREAALTPAIYQELWEQYGSDLPSNETLRWQLVTQHGFTETGYEEFLRQYRDTIAFADLRAVEEPAEPTLIEPDSRRHPGIIDTDPNNSRVPTGPALPRTSSYEVSSQAPNQPIPPGAARFPVPLVGGGTVVVEGAFPITEQAWTRFLAVLQAMKPGLVRGDDRLDR